MENKRLAPDLPGTIRPPAYSLFLVLGASLLLSVCFSPPFDVLNPDKEIFSYAGLVIARGGAPYRDVFDHKPPLIYFIDVIGLLPGGLWTYWLFATGVALGATALFFRRCVEYKLPFPWLLPLLFNLLVHDFLICKTIGWTREWTTWFFLLFFCTLMGGHRLKHYLLGVFTGLVVFTQQEEVLALIPFLLYVVLEKKTVWRGTRIGEMALGFGMIFVPLLLFFAVHHALADFWRDAVLFNLHWYTAEKESFLDHFRMTKLILDTANYEIPVVVALIFGITGLLSRHRRKGLLLATLAALPLAAVSEFMGGRNMGGRLAADFSYYFLPLSAAICIVLFVALAFSEEPLFTQRRAQLPFVFLLCCSLVYTDLQHIFHLPRRNAEPVLSSPAIDYLRRQPLQDYQLYIFNSDGYLYAYNEFRILSPSPWIYHHPWDWFPNWDPHQEVLKGIAADLLKHHTRYVIMDPAYLERLCNPINRDWWRMFMSEHYQQVPLPGGRSILWQSKDPLY